MCLASMHPVYARPLYSAAPAWCWRAASLLAELVCCLCPSRRQLLCHARVARGERRGTVRHRALGCGRVSRVRMLLGLSNTTKSRCTSCCAGSSPCMTAGARPMVDFLHACSSCPSRTLPPSRERDQLPHVAARAQGAPQAAGRGGVAAAGHQRHCHAQELRHRPPRPGAGSGSLVGRICASCLLPAAIPGHLRPGQHWSSQPQLPYPPATLLHHIVAAGGQAVRFVRRAL